MWVHKCETVIILILHIVSSWAAFIKPAEKLKPVVCPQFCACLFDQEPQVLSCQWQSRWKKTTWINISEFLIGRPHIGHLAVGGGLPAVPEFQERVEGLKFLSLVNNKLTALQSKRFTGLPNLMNLDLSNNSIVQVDKQAFTGLHELEYLNLSGNQIVELPPDVFQDVPLLILKVVNLSSNLLESIPPTVFYLLRHVEVIDLASNRLSYITSVHFRGLTQLKTLILARNRFTIFHSDLMPVFQSVPSIDLSGNPFDCSCAVLALRDTIDQLASSSSSSNHSLPWNKTQSWRRRDASHHFVNLDKYRCRTPESLSGEAITALNIARLSCAVPTITKLPEHQDIQVRGDLYLKCEAFGYPSPAIVWLTPWGKIYSHPRHYPLLGDDSTEITDSQSYETLSVGVTRINVLENGTLHISGFRGYFAGNFTCVGVGPTGNASYSAYIRITSRFHAVYIESLFVGLYSSSIFLVFGILVGSLRLLFTKLEERLEKKKKQKEQEEMAKNEEENETATKNESLKDRNSSCLDDYKDDDYHDDSDDHSGGSGVYAASPVSLTPEAQKKFPTPEDTSPSGWSPGNILETLDEARSRLSIGVGRKMEKVRSQVQSFRESGTVYVQNIKTTSSVAANRVKAGVVLGVETIKYSAQSIREFCWNGDMSGQTISMVSMSTNVDTEKQTEVIQTVTFV